MEGPLSDEEVDLFGAYTGLVPIIVAGSERWVPEDNSLLRVLQFLELKTGCVRLEWGRYCWNDTKGCCRASVRDPDTGEVQEVRACRTRVSAGLEVLALPPGGRAR